MELSHTSQREAAELSLCKPGTAELPLCQSFVAEFPRPSQEPHSSLCPCQEHPSFLRTNLIQPIFFFCHNMETSGYPRPSLEPSSSLVKLDSLSLLMIDL